ncbi:hypothetical protein ASG33_07205 [Dyadobacter sp. Leaf189]|nr:hypothetical protein ASG33_07205 [Dyadobacter sp. Leaf189]
MPQDISIECVAYILYRVYMLLLVICCGISFYVYLHDRSLTIFRYIFLWALLVEVLVFYIDRGKLNFPLYTLYHFYIPVEFTLVIAFLSQWIEQLKFRRLAYLSIILFCIISFISSHYITGWTHFPGLNLNIEGSLLILWAMVVMFSVKPNLSLAFYKLPIFWICLSIIIYHSGTFVMNGIFNALQKHDTVLFKSLRVINQGFNILEYLMFIIALMLSNGMKKSVYKKSPGIL